MNTVPPVPPSLDLIGDIHGHAAELEALLAKLGYTRRGGSYGHPQRRVIFLGDNRPRPADQGDAGHRARHGGGRERRGADGQP